MRNFQLATLILGLLAAAPAARAELLHCYVGVGSNEAPSCEAKPAELDFGAGQVARAYDTPDFRLILRPSALVSGAYDSSLTALKAEGFQTFVFETMIASRQGLVLQTDPRAPFTSTVYQPGPGQNLYFKAGAPDFSHPALLKRFAGTIAFIDTVDGPAELYVGVGMLKAILCQKADPRNEAAWRDFVAHFSQQCVN